MGMKMSGAAAMVKALELEGVEVIFGYPGAAICPFYNSLSESDIRHILTRHEQGAAHAASGYSRIKGKPGVCVATSGPGAVNLITGIATAYMDSIALVAITGQVNSSLIGRDVFQEADITGATTPFCKHNYLVKKAAELPRIMKEAFYIASTGRPGPVLIDVPIDVQLEELEFNYPARVDIKGYKPTEKGHHIQIEKIAEAVGKSIQPVICAGGGVISSGATDELVKLAEKCNIPVVTTLMGKGSIPFSHPLNMGMLGSHGVASANTAVNNADFLLILGARVADRAMNSPSGIASRAVVAHIDVDPAEIGKNMEAHLPVVGDVRYVLKHLLEKVKSRKEDEWNKRLEEIRNKRRKGENDEILTERIETENGRTDFYIKPKAFLRQLSQIVAKDAVITTEVGQNQIWTANNFRFENSGKFITSGGLGTMGYGLPAAIGAKVAAPESTVIVISGDGSFQMSLQELGTMKQNNLDIKIILFNNQRLGMVRELQKQKYCSNYTAVFLEHNPDFIKLFEAYGFKGKKLTGKEDKDGIVEAMNTMLNHKGAYLLECPVDPEEPTL